MLNMLNRFLDRFKSRDDFGDDSDQFDRSFNRIKNKKEEKEKNEPEIHYPKNNTNEPSERDESNQVLSIKSEKEEKEPESYYPKDNVYETMRGSLLKRHELGLPLVVNVHFPGSGGKCGTRYATLKGLLKAKKECERQGIDFVLLCLSGVGSELNEDNIPPIHQDPKSCDQKEKETKSSSLISKLINKTYLSSTIISKSVVSDSEEELAELTEENKSIGMMVGQLLGVGMRKNVDRISNFFEKLKKDPEAKKLFADKNNKVIFNFVGHSRGYINAIMAANMLKEKFPKETEAYLGGTDPVTGVQRLHPQLEKWIISTEVAAAFILYSSNLEGMNNCFIPSQINALKSKSGSSYSLTSTPGATCVTAIPLDGRNHISITGDERVINTTCNVALKLSSTKKNLNKDIKKDDKKDEGLKIFSTFQTNDNDNLTPLNEITNPAHIGSVHQELSLYHVDPNPNDGSLASIVTESARRGLISKNTEEELVKLTNKRVSANQQYDKEEAKKKEEAKFTQEDTNSFLQTRTFSK